VINTVAIFLSETIWLPVASQHAISNEGHIEAYRIIECVRYEKLKFGWCTLESVNEVCCFLYGSDSSHKHMSWRPTFEATCERQRDALAPARDYEHSAHCRASVG
jgi:hypothetical protein